MTYQEWKEEVLTAVQLGIPYFAEAALAVEIPTYEVFYDCGQDQPVSK